MSAVDERDWITWIGLGVVGAAAAVMSFTALAELARLCGITGSIPFDPPGPATAVPVAWLLPLTVDVLAAVATRVWLRRRTNAEALGYARWSAWSAIGATVVGNAAHGALVQSGHPAPWWAVVIVSAVPAVALGAMVHLAVLVGRGSDQPGRAPAQDPWWVLLDQFAAEPWDQAIAAWSARSVASVRTVPDREQPDEVLAADLRSAAADQGRPLSRDEVIGRYGIGATRAARVRQLAGQPTGPTVTAVA